MSEPYQQPPQQPYPPQPYGSGAKLPGVVVAASIIWIIYGALGLIGNLIGLAAGGRPGASTAIGLGIAVAFLMSGIQALGGKLKGLLASGICSIVLGALTAIAFLALSALIRGFRAPGWLLGIGLVLGLMLVTAGILACVGNAAYKQYRATKS